MKVTNEGIFIIHQKNYIEKLLKTFKMEDARGSRIPLDPGYFKTEITNEESFQNNDLYRKAVGSLLYLSINTRPDISICTSILGRKVSNPSLRDWTEVKRVFRYLKMTADLKLKLGNSEERGKLIGYADADWAGDSNDRKSTSGLIVKLHGSTITWSSKKQSSVSLSSTEAEYISLCEACQEIQWIKKLLEDFKENIDDVTIYEDNQSTLKLLDNECAKNKSKHIAVKFYFIRDLKKSGEIKFVYCPTTNMIADIMTKPLNLVKVEQFRKTIGLVLKN